MKKLKITFICSIALILLFSGTVFAYSVNLEEYKLNKTYTKQFTGQASVSAVVSDGNDTYMTVTNTSDGVRHIAITVGENKKGIGWTKKDSRSSDIVAGLQLLCTIERNMSDTNVYYFHNGKCLENKYNNRELDSYVYTAKQFN